MYFGGRTDQQVAIAAMWDEFQRNNNVALHKDGIELPDSTTSHWAILFADYVVGRKDHLAFLTEAMTEARKNLGKPIPARVWFDKHKGICPTCGLDMNGLLGKVDFSVIPHLNGTCKQ